ncbi:MAG TPA: oxygenase MpaB family protein [Sandaracinaceae bacterium]
MNERVRRIRERFTNEELERWRTRCDPLADAALEAIVAARRDGDLLATCRRLATSDERCAALLAHVRRPPAWARLEEHRLAHRLFARNGPWILMLGFPVLVDSYAGARDNKVLVMSGRLAGRGAFDRLVETARFVESVCSPGSLEVEHEGWRNVLRVRLLHAWVRKLCREAGHDVARYGEPINQEAMAGTLVLFGHGTLECMRRMGIAVTDAEAESWHGLWRHAGWLLGVHPELLPETYAEEVALYERIKQHEYRPDDDTRALFDAAVRDVTRGAGERMPLWFRALGGWTLASPQFLEQLTVRCVDERVWRYLGLRPSLRWRAFFEAIAIGQSGLSRAAQRSRAVESANRALVGRLAKQLPAVLAGTRAAPRYDDPGFRELRVAS